MKKSKIKLIIILLLIAVTGVGVYYYFFRDEKSIIQLDTVKVEKNDITSSVTATGTIEPIDEVEVGTQVSGTIDKIFVDYNSGVKKGQLIAQLDTQTLQASLDDARASYNSALNDLNYYQQNYNRQQSMYNSQVISKADLESAEYHLKSAQQTVAQRKSNLANAQTNLSYASIYSPIDGMILTKEVEEGQTVAASMSTPTLFTIAKDLTKVQVEASVDEADIGYVKEGLRVEFTVDAYPDDVFEGTVSQVRIGASSSDDTSGSGVVTYTVVISTYNDDLKLKPGLTANVEIFTQELKKVDSLEAQAFNFSPDQELLSQYYIQSGLKPQPMGEIKSGKGNIKYVWIKNSKGYLEQKEITTGANNSIRLQITGGLNEGDEVITGLQEVRAKEIASGANGADSPFMPKPPGKRK